MCQFAVAGLGGTAGDHELIPVNSWRSFFECAVYLLARKPTVMSTEFVPILAVFLAVFVIFVIGGRLLAPIVAQHFKGAAGGWSRLCEVYATTRHLPTQLLRRQTVVVGQVLYRNCINVGFDDIGLYLAPGFPVSIFGKPPLFFPWTKITRVEEGRLFWRKAAVLSLGEPVVGTISMPMELFNSAVRPALAKQQRNLPGETLLDCWNSSIRPARTSSAQPFTCEKCPTSNLPGS